MNRSIPLRCRCGAVRGVAEDVGPATGNRVLCHCDDCQAFAHYLQSPDALDAAGGTDIFQLAPAQLRITAGAGEIRCLRLTPRGAHRWYAGCCKTPLANTGGARMPFVGVIHCFMDHAGDGVSRDAALGPVVASIQTKFAVGTPRIPERRSATVRAVGKAIRLMSGWWLRGRVRPSPFFDAATGAPLASPYVLARAEREALRPLATRVDRGL